jgi:hypothetical protein
VRERERARERSTNADAEGSKQRSLVVYDAEKFTSTKVRALLVKKSAHTDVEGAAALAGGVRRREAPAGRYSIYLLYWNKRQKYKY